MEDWKKRICKCGKEYTKRTSCSKIIWDTHYKYCSVPCRAKYIPKTAKQLENLKGGRTGIYTLGRKRPKWEKEQISKSMIGVNTWMKGRTPTPETLQKMREVAKTRRGVNHHNWKGGISPLYERIRKSVEYKDWRVAVQRRDNWTCVECGYKGSEIEVDHIKPFCNYPELRFEISNGRVLCKLCHRKTPTWGGVKSNNLRLRQPAQLEY